MIYLSVSTIGVLGDVKSKLNDLRFPLLNLRFTSTYIKVISNEIDWNDKACFSKNINHIINQKEF